jgi:hypothetical protein
VPSSGSLSLPAKLQADLGLWLITFSVVRGCVFIVWRSGVTHHAWHQIATHTHTHIYIYIYIYGVALVLPTVTFSLKQGVNRRRGVTLDTQGNWEELGDMIRGGIQFISQRPDFSVGSH